MRKHASLILSLLAAAACGIVTPDPVDNYKGLLINEIAAHDQTVDAESWVELYNPGTEAINLEGAGLFIADKYFKDRQIWTGKGVIGPGERLLISTSDGSLTTGIASDDEFKLRLGTKDVTTDAFERSVDCPETLAARGSYQRIPDGGERWQAFTYNSRGRENELFDYTRTKHTAIWVWSSHISSWMADDCKMMKHLYQLGYRHILLNYAAFHPNNTRTTLAFLEAAEATGWTVHAWLQCFYNGGWVNPVDDENNRYKEDVFERIRDDARKYIEEFGVKGLHLDYIRFGGTASKHNPSAEVNSVGAVNKCCREIREVADSYNEGIVTSAALMPEVNSTQYYGQNPSLMGKYIHILMPMIYRYSYHYTDASCKSVANWFADNSGGASMWSGIQTYTGGDNNVTPMSAEEIRKDIDIFMDTRGTGIVLFRYGLGTFPDVNDLP
ncbi:MAG: hypothetical protein J5640_09125 [Bacteroidales bacterium]|nr:hypothetical protein [Bacteroidales bacterium]